MVGQPLQLSKIVITTDHIYFHDLSSSSIKFPDRLVPGVAAISSVFKFHLRDQRRLIVDQRKIWVVHFERVEL